MSSPVHKSSCSACKSFLLCRGFSCFPKLPVNPDQKEMPSRKQRASFGGVISQRELHKCTKKQVGSFSLEGDRRNKGAGHTLEDEAFSLETKSHRCCLGLSRCCSSGYSSGMTSSAGCVLWFLLPLRYSSVQQSCLKGITLLTSHKKIPNFSISVYDFFLE